MRPAAAGRAVGITRTGVMLRVANKRYQTEEVGGVVFIVVDDVLRADMEAHAARSAEAAASAA